jgi:8-oxo-dGTP diphosphatase
MWEFPGGKLGPGEGPRAGAIRELLEECGVEAQARDLLPDRTCEYEDRSIVLYPVICHWLRGDARPIDCVACKWVSLDKLALLDMPTINAEIIAAARRWIQTH